MSDLLSNASYFESWLGLKLGCYVAVMKPEIILVYFSWLLILLLSLKLKFYFPIQVMGHLIADSAELLTTKANFNPK